MSNNNNEQDPHQDTSMVIRSVELIKSILSICSKLLENDTSDEEISRKLAEMQKIFENLDLMKEKVSSVDNSVKSTLGTDTKSEEKNVLWAKSFVIKYEFKNVSSMKEDEKCYTLTEEHFGIPWSLGIVRKGNQLSAFLYCDRSEPTKPWSIEARLKLHVFRSKGGAESNDDSFIYVSEIGHGWDSIVKWDDLVKNYLEDDKLTVEVTASIKKIIGIYKEDSRSFDEGNRKFSDMVLIVNDKKFYVSKLYLATHSPFFESLFLGRFAESSKSEVVLFGISSDDFQKYLEILYGEQPIDEFTVEGILLIGDMYVTQLVIRKCEEFLIEKSEKTARKKLEMAYKYNLKNLKKKCLSNIKTLEDVRGVVHGNVSNMDSEITAALLEKVLSFK